RPQPRRAGGVADLDGVGVAAIGAGRAVDGVDARAVGAAERARRRLRPGAVHALLDVADGAAALRAVGARDAHVGGAGAAAGAELRERPVAAARGLHVAGLQRIRARAARVAGGALIGARRGAVAAGADLAARARDRIGPVAAARRLELARLH